MSASTVVPYPDGPLVIRGDFSLEDVEGTPIERPGRTVALCRCGKSQRKPFCDGTHKLRRRSAIGTDSAADEV